MVLVMGLETAKAGDLEMDLVMVLRPESVKVAATGLVLGSAQQLAPDY